MITRVTAEHEIVDSRYRSGKAILGFSVRKFYSNSPEVLAVGCGGKYVKPLVLCLISPRSCRITVPSDYESEGKESATVFVHSLLHHNIACILSGEYLFLFSISTTQSQLYISTYLIGRILIFI